VFNQYAYRDKKVVGVFVRFRAPLRVAILPPSLLADNHGMLPYRCKPLYSTKALLGQIVRMVSILDWVLPFFISFTKHSATLDWTSSLQRFQRCNQHINWYQFCHIFRALEMQ
jgi:hypothetical protein